MHVNLKWNRSRNDTCPLCHKSSETWQHVHRCPCADIQRLRVQQIQELETLLINLRTLPELQHHIIRTMRQWHNDEHIPEGILINSSSEYADDLIVAHKNQMKVGYDLFVKGFLVREWGMLQRRYYSKEIRDNKYNSVRWTRVLVDKLLTIGNMIWEERCSILHAEKRLTEEARYREYLYELLLDLKKDPTKVGDISKKQIKHPWICGTCGSKQT